MVNVFGSIARAPLRCLHYIALAYSLVLLRVRKVLSVVEQVDLYHALSGQPLDSDDDSDRDTDCCSESSFDSEATDTEASSDSGHTDTEPQDTAKKEPAN